MWRNTRIGRFAYIGTIYILCFSRATSTHRVYRDIQGDEWSKVLVFENWRSCCFAHAAQSYAYLLAGSAIFVSSSSNNSAPTQVRCVDGRPPFAAVKLFVLFTRACLIFLFFTVRRILRVQYCTASEKKYRVFEGGNTCIETTKRASISSGGRVRGKTGGRGRLRSERVIRSVKWRARPRICICVDYYIVFFFLSTYNAHTDLTADRKP